MTATSFHLKKPPIIEAVIDIDCDLPSSLDLAELDTAMSSALGDCYPIKNARVFQEHQVIQDKDTAPSVEVRRGVEAFQYFTKDQKQLVQIRRNGFSFNRLAPYEGMDVYFPEIERRWKLFVEFAQPTLVRQIGLRTINRIVLPMDGNRAPLDEYFINPPRLPDVANLTFAGFVHQYRTVESTTSNQANVVLTAQDPQLGNLPIILDIHAFRASSIEPQGWIKIAEVLRSLRSLKNQVFRKTVTEKCLKQY